MNILFLTILNINSIDERNIYTDLIRKFKTEGHNVLIVCPTERRFNKKTHLIKENGVNILKIKTFNLQKSNLIEKGIGIILLEYQFLNGIKKYLKSSKFDLLIYSTPPITFSKVVQYFQRQGKIFSYLLLKDIFPQNAVDLKMIKENGFLHAYFKKKEKRLYSISNKIGCMSLANVDYLMKFHPNLVEKLEVNTNSIELKPFTFVDKIEIRKKYDIPLDKIVFVYGGNLGKPQGIDFLLDIINASENKIDRAYFLIIGNGTEYKRINEWLLKRNPLNAKLVDVLPKKEYDNIVKSSDIGMIFLNPNFTIPNFPSRLLSYLENGLPIFSATDSNTDIFLVIEDNKFGFGVISGDLKSAMDKIEELTQNSSLRKEMGENGSSFLVKNYNVDISYNKIIDANNQFKVLPK
jgi:glycosyltransferase involved in cell wall biosynthesis